MGSAWIACLVCLALVVVSATLFGLAFSSLGANEVGLVTAAPGFHSATLTIRVQDYSRNSMLIDTTQLYSSGVHFLGVGHKFISFPLVRFAAMSFCLDPMLAERTRAGHS